MCCKSAQGCPASCLLLRRLGGSGANGGNPDRLGRLTEVPVEGCEREATADGDFQISGVVDAQAVPAGATSRWRQDRA